MKEFFLTSAGIFIFYAPLIFDRVYCQIPKASLQRNPNKNLRYALFKDHLFHVLDAKKLEGDTVHTWKHCLLRCVKNEQCFSTNIGAFPRPNGNFTCELLPTDKYNASNKFKANHTFHHYSIVVSGILGAPFLILSGECYSRFACFGQVILVHLQDLEILYNRLSLIGNWQSFYCREITV